MFGYLGFFIRSIYFQKVSKSAAQFIQHIYAMKNHSQKCDECHWINKPKTLKPMSKESINLVIFELLIVCVKIIHPALCLKLTVRKKNDLLLFYWRCSCNQGPFSKIYGYWINKTKILQPMSKEIISILSGPINSSLKLLTILAKIIWPASYLQDTVRR